MQFDADSVFGESGLVFEQPYSLLVSFELIHVFKDAPAQAMQVLQYCEVLL